jgi:hypothetical protein
VFVNAISSFMSRFIPPTTETIAIIASELDDVAVGNISELLEELELEYSYGRSPPVYPSRRFTRAQVPSCVAVQSNVCFSQLRQQGSANGLKPIPKLGSSSRR